MSSAPLISEASDIYLDQMCMLGNVDKIRQFAKEGRDLARPYTYENKSPLYWAASQNRLELVQYLLTTEDTLIHPKAEFDQRDILSLFKCERVEVLDYLIFNHHLIYDNTLFVALNDTLETMAYSQESNVDKFQTFLSYMISSFEKNVIEQSLNKENTTQSNNKNNNKIKL